MDRCRYHAQICIQVICSCPSLCQKGGHVQSILDKTYLQKEASQRVFGGNGWAPLGACAACTFYASVGATSNYLMFESNHFLDLANQRFFSPQGQNTFILFSSP